MERKQTSIRYRSSKDKLVFVLVCIVGLIDAAVILHFVGSIQDTKISTYSCFLSDTVVDGCYASHITANPYPRILNGITGTLLIVGVAFF